MDYEEEEIQVKEVEKEVVTEINMPQVKTLFKYKGQGMGFEKGEVGGQSSFIYMRNIILGTIVRFNLA